MTGKPFAEIKSFLSRRERRKIRKVDLEIRINKQSAELNEALNLTFQLLTSICKEF